MTRRRNRRRGSSKKRGNRIRLLRTRRRSKMIEKNNTIEYNIVRKYFSFDIGRILREDQDRDQVNVLIGSGAKAGEGEGAFLGCKEE